MEKIKIEMRSGTSTLEIRDKGYIHDFINRNETIYAIVIVGDRIQTIPLDRLLVLDSKEEKLV